ncbi:MAG: hypothetical protein MJY78_02830 [Fibrobacter sp.]|nr:hypothetical protein [Fibrobacter sp.]
MKVRFCFFILCAILLQACVGRPTTSSPKKEKLVVYMQEVEPSQDTASNRNDYIGIFQMFETERENYYATFEKIPLDSSWIVVRTIYYDADMSDSLMEWESIKKDTLNDTATYTRIVTSLKGFESETLMVNPNRIPFASINVSFRHEGKLAYAIAQGPGGVTQSLKMETITREISKWIRDDFVRVELTPDSNLIRARSKLEEQITCKVYKEVEKNGFLPNGKDDPRKFVVTKGESQLHFDFSKLKPDERIACRSYIGYIGFWVP